MKILIISSFLLLLTCAKKSDCESELFQGFDCSNDCVVSYQCSPSTAKCEHKFLQDNQRFLTSQKNTESCDKIQKTQGCQLLKYVQNCINTIEIKDMYGKEFQKTVKCQKNCWAKIKNRWPPDNIYKILLDKYRNQSTVSSKSWV